jgi:KUP system potassium uptake protein
VVRFRNIDAGNAHGLVDRSGLHTRDRRSSSPSGVAPGALGVVFGDIGTSPIYAFREALRAAGGPSEAAVFGVLSLVFWAIILVVAIKYVVFVMRADNEGEGGTMALLSLALPVAGRLQTGLLIVGLAGASLFFGDAMITPAISVLSAVEGLRIVSPIVTPYVVPIAAVVLVCLFSI